ncbi:IucA/IucC family siderophore biosynthesis protein [Halobacillus locisalis]|uniref:IucA/IucC family siderophore biosynthesis protein n=2 Tax=Halobacillus locisalis TaxID=220753 RepID=A0A838CSX8_9BACI|nr:IucA/IucC family siderophore biosynthesis protein [Halobacillus locisalis]
MLKEERTCLNALMADNPDDVPRFLDQVEGGRQGILHKLASAILREDIDQIYTNAINVTETAAHPYSRQLESYPFLENVTYKLTVQEGYAIVFPVLSEFSFRRVETTGDILFVDDLGVRPITTASELVELLFKDSAHPNVDTFMKELDNGTANLTLALMHHEKWKTHVQRLGSLNTLDYVKKQQAIVPQFSPSLFFEQLVVDGHHLHPGAKTKLGLTYADVTRYSPEFHQSFDVRFVGVLHDRLLTTSAQLLKKDFSDTWEQAQVELQQKGYDPDNYEVLPVHPWQYEHAIPSIYKEEIESGDVLLLEDVIMQADATSSFRTVSPRGDQTPVIKLAVNSQMTSTVRSISKQTAMNSTAFTSMMETVMEREDLPRFVPLNETAGAAFDSDDELKSRNLTMLIRESIDAHLQEGEIAIAGMALYAESPMSGKTVLHELVEESGQHVLDFFQQYIQTVIPGYMTLMVKYGIALEGHLQNSLPVFKNGRLSRFFFRDWGGARVYEPRLEKQGIAADFAPGSVSVTNDLSDMHNKLYYTVFQNHLGEIIRQLTTYGEVDESVLWQQVKKVCDQTLDTLAKEEGLHEQIAEDRAFLYQPTVMHKSLTHMRLTDSKAYHYTEVPNPLS